MVAHHTPKKEPHARTSRTLFRMDFKRTRTRATAHCIAGVRARIFPRWGPGACKRPRGPVIFVGLQGNQGIQATSRGPKNRGAAGHVLGTLSMGWARAGGARKDQEARRS